MRKFNLFPLMAFIVIMLFASPSFASNGFWVNGVPAGAVEDINVKNTSSTVSTFSDGFTFSIPVLDPSLFAAGTGAGGAVSQTSAQAAVSSTATFIRKVLPTNGDAAFTAGTLANGKPGQILTIYAIGGSPSGATTGLNYTITPTTKTGYISVKLSAVNDVVTFLYVDDTTGWVIVSYDPATTSSITITR